MEIIIKGIYQENSEELMRLKGEILTTIAKSPIEFINLQKMQFKLNDKLMELNK